MDERVKRTIQILEEARRRVALGWCQHAFVRHDDRGRPVAWCLGGATGFDPEAAPADLLIAKAIGTHFANIATWNDAPGRTRTDVLRVLDKAISLAREAQP